MNWVPRGVMNLKRDERVIDSAKETTKTKISRETLKEFIRLAWWYAFESYT